MGFPRPGGGSSGAMSLIAETVLAAPAASIDFTNIPATYRHLRLVIAGRQNAGASGPATVSARFNGSAVAAYDMNGFSTTGGGTMAASAIGTAFNDVSMVVGLMADAGAAASYPGLIDMLIGDYRNTALFKRIQSHASSFWQGSSAEYAGFFAGMWKSLAVINQVTLLPPNPFATGTVATLYGLTGGS